jgi:hypothetical protein
VAEDEEMEASGGSGNEEEMAEEAEGEGLTRRPSEGGREGVSAMLGLHREALRGRASPPEAASEDQGDGNHSSTITRFSGSSGLVQSSQPLSPSHAWVTVWPGQPRGHPLSCPPIWCCVHF